MVDDNKLGMRKVKIDVSGNDDVPVPGDSGKVGLSEKMAPVKEKANEHDIPDEARIRAMVQLEDYIKYNLYYGHSRKAVRDALLKAGWSADVIDSTMKKVEKPKALKKVAKGVGGESESMADSAMDIVPAPGRTGVSSAESGNLAPEGAVAQKNVSPAQPASVGVPPAQKPAVSAAPGFQDKFSSQRPQIIGSQMPAHEQAKVIKDAVSGGSAPGGEGGLGMRKVKVDISEEAKAKQAEPKPLDQVEKELQAKEMQGVQKKEGVGVGHGSAVPSAEKPAGVTRRVEGGVSDNQSKVAPGDVSPAQPASGQQPGAQGSVSEGKPAGAKKDLKDILASATESGEKNKEEEKK